MQCCLLVPFSALLHQLLLTPLLQLLLNCSSAPRLLLPSALPSCWAFVCKCEYVFQTKSSPRLLLHRAQSLRSRSCLRNHRTGARRGSRMPRTRTTAENRRAQELVELLVELAQELLALLRRLANDLLQIIVGPVRVGSRVVHLEVELVLLGRSEGVSIPACVAKE